MYIIHGNYTGHFRLGFPFEFVTLKDAREVCVYLNGLRDHIAEWQKFKPFQIWDGKTGKFVE